jgi:Transposase DDE domain group 1
LEKLPTRKFFANWAWLLMGQLAVNLVAWFKRLVLPAQYHTSTIKTIRYHLLNLAGRIVASGRQFFLVLSDHYSFKDVWQFAQSVSRTGYLRALSVDSG